MQRLPRKLMPVRVTSSPFSSDNFKSLLHIIDSLLPIVKEEPPLQKMSPACILQKYKFWKWHLGNKWPLPDLGLILQPLMDASWMGTHCAVPTGIHFAWSLLETGILHERRDFKKAPIIHNMYCPQLPLDPPSHCPWVGLWVFVVEPGLVLVWQTTVVSQGPRAKQRARGLGLGTWGESL